MSREIRRSIDSDAQARDSSGAARAFSLLLALGAGVLAEGCAAPKREAPVATQDGTTSETRFETGFERGLKTGLDPKLEAGPVLPVPSVVTPLMPGTSVREDGGREARFEAWAPDRQTPIEKAPDRQAPIDAGSDASPGARALAEVRRPLPERPSRAPLPADVSRILTQAAEALARDDLSAALALAGRAAAFVPDRPEPVEMQLLARLALGSSDEVREAVTTLASIDPANPIVLAFVGLDALQRGDDRAALASLAWFVGEGALPRRGAAIPLPTAKAELEEQTAICALRAGRPALALIALEAAAGARGEGGDSGAARDRLALLESDALLALGRHDEALAALDLRFRRPDSDEPLARLAMLRRDRIALVRGSALQAVASSLASVAGDPLDDVAFWRCATLLRSVAGGGALLPKDGFGPTQSNDAASLARRGLIEAIALEPLRADRLRKALVAVETDRIAFAIGIGALAAASPDAAIDAAVDAVGRDPERADGAASALLGSGLGLDEIAAMLDASGAGASTDAIRSRLRARIGRPEEAFAIADLARSRDGASAAALSAAALAAGELGDETLLGEIDAAALASGARIGASLEIAWTSLGQPERASDRRARLGASRTSDAPSARADALLSGLVAEARALDAERFPLALEMIALAEAIDPSREAVEILLEPLRARTAPGALAAYARAAAAEAPALPARRRLLGRVAELPADGPEIADGAGLVDRLDAEIRASDAGRVELEIARARARPRTAEGIAALAALESRAGRIAEAVALIESASARPQRATSARGARQLFRAAAETGARDPSAAAAAWRVAERVLPAAAGLDASDVGRLAFLWSASGEPADALRSLLSSVVQALRLEDADLDALRRTLSTLRTDAGDSLPAAEVAAAIAEMAALPVGLRSALGSSAIALYAESGGSAEASRRLVLRLAESGATPLVRPEEASGDSPRPDAARTLVRAASVHDLLTDAAGNRALLRAALEVDPSLGEAMNNLAYLDVEERTIGDETVRMAERAAAAAPDDPAALDTLACVRYHQGRFRDDAAGPGAITLFRQALRLRPEDPSLSTLDRLGDALWRDGDQEGAIRCWQQVGQVAALRYPPEPIARGLLEHQRREFGIELVDPIEYVRRRYGSVVERAEGKLRDAAAGRPPMLLDCSAIR